MKNNHTLLHFKQRLQTAHSRHTAHQLNLMELRHHTTQHSGNEAAQEDVSFFSTNKTIQACALVKAKWTRAI